MNRTLKIRQSETQKVFLTSDFHLNHNPKWENPIWKMRGFNSVVEMNDAIIKSTNDIVKSTDILFFLGDFVLNCNESQFEEFLSRIKCQNIYMIFGNHNSCVWNIYQRETKRYLEYVRNMYGEGNVVTECKKYLEQVREIDGNWDVEIYPFRYRNIIFVGNYLEICVDNQYFVVSHYPQSSWNGMAKGSILCHGHIHSTEETYIQNGKMIDVGFDYHRRPISVDEIKKIMNDVIIKHEGHH